MSLRLTVSFFLSLIHFGLELISVAAVLGVVLFAGGLTVFLLPFTLASRAPNGWKTDYIIAMIVVGFAVLVAFGLYETYVAKEPFLKNKFLTDRSVIAACLIDMTYQISYYCWNSYFTSFLQVVCNLTVAEAGYVRDMLKPLPRITNTHAKSRSTRRSKSSQACCFSSSATPSAAPAASNGSST